jgi:hypothetical protein
MNSATLCLVSLNAYQRIYPNSFFRRPLRKEDLKPAGNSLVFLGFSELSGLARGTKDYFVILKLIEQNVNGVCEMIRTGKNEKFIAKFKRLKKETGKEIIEKFEKYFREEEKKV